MEHHGGIIAGEIHSSMIRRGKEMFSNPLERQTFIKIKTIFYYTFLCVKSGLLYSSWQLNTDVSDHLDHVGSIVSDASQHLIPVDL
jgi:hypothetical protein